MRIVSQDGRYDLPYEKVAVNMCGELEIIAENTEIQNWFVTMGRYSTKEKVNKVLEDLRNEYRKYYMTQGGLLATADHYVQPFGFVPPKVFQFPQDSEVEV